MSFGEAVAGRVHLASAGVDSGKLEVRGQSFGPGYGAGIPPGAADNNPAALWPPNTPISFKPYPEISPYYPPNVARDATYNDRGLWFREILHRRRDYYFDLEYLLTGYAGPGNRNIGAPTIPVNIINNSPLGHVLNNYDLGGPAQFGPGGTQGFATIIGQQRVLVGPGVLPYPVFPDTAGGPNLVRTTNFAFPVHTLDVINNPVEADGIRARLGYANEDGTGMMLTGWYGGLGQDAFQRGTDNWWGIPITQDLIVDNTPNNGNAPVFPRNGVLPLEEAEGRFIPFDSDQGVSQTFGFTGISQKFDVLYLVEAETRAFGTTLNVYHEPIFKRKWVTVRPSYGARYVYIDDRFRFRGIDSGLFYAVDDGGAAGGGGGAAGGAAPTFRPTGGSVFVFMDANGLEVDFFFEANLKSEVDSHLAGPEVGLRYDFGQSKNFSIWGQSTFALLANTERVKIAGENIGLPYEEFLNTGMNFLDPGVDTTFVDSDTHTHASPMFEQSIFVEANLLRYVPLINRCHVLEEAQIHGGYTYTVIGQMARAGESIQWKAFPDFPFVNIDYRTWWMHNWSFGVSWNY